jgi:hypothetical protein
MGYLVERVARAIVDRRKLPADADVNWDAFMSDAKAALAMTADWIEQRYGSLHPGAVCIRHELSQSAAEQ